MGKRQVKGVGSGKVIDDNAGNEVCDKSKKLKKMVSIDNILLGRN